jgi:hypothetical protein
MRRAAVSGFFLFNLMNGSNKQEVKIKFNLILVVLNLFDGIFPAILCLLCPTTCHPRLP